MLRVQAARTATLWESLLPEDVRVLPEDLAALDELLADPIVLATFRAHWEAEITAGVHRLGLIEGLLSVVTRSGPTIPMETYLRLMVLEHRHGWGYETLVREVADSFHPPAPVLPARPGRVRARRVHHPQAHPPHGGADHRRAHPRRHRHRGADTPVPAPGVARGLHGDRGSSRRAEGAWRNAPAAGAAGVLSPAWSLR